MPSIDNLAQIKKMTDENMVVCKFCGSKNVTRHGRRFEKIGIVQIYSCKDCHRKFGFGPGTGKFGMTENIREDALLYLANHSSRDTAKYVGKKYGIPIRYTSILYWKKKFENKRISFSEEKKTKPNDLSDPRHPDYHKPYAQEYIKKYGIRKVEANAIVINPHMGRELCEKTILKWISLFQSKAYDPFENYEINKEKIENKLLTIMREIGLRKYIKKSLKVIK